MHQYIALEETVYFGFAANLTTGAGGDGATPLFDVRLGGAAAGAAPVYSGTPTLLSNAGYLDGSYEVAIPATAANGFAAGNTYLVFVTLTIDGVTPGACIGSFKTTAIPTANENADALLKRDWTAVTGEAARSVLNALRFLRNKWSISGTTITVTEEDDTTTAWTGTLSSSASADPVTGLDPG